MRKAEKVLRIQQVLDQFYPDVSIPLTHRNTYTLLIAVVLSAQTTDKKVNQITPALFALANTPQQMAELPESTIKQAIQEIGLSNVKAKNLKQLSRLLVERHGEEVPENFADLEKWSNSLGDRKFDILHVLHVIVRSKVTAQITTNPLIYLDSFSSLSFLSDKLLETF